MGEFGRAYSSWDRFPIAFPCVELTERIQHLPPGHSESESDRGNVLPHLNSKVIPAMATKLQFKTDDQLGVEDGAVLRLLATGPMDTDRVGQLLGLNGDEIASSIRRLFYGGFVSLGIVRYPWGVEYEVRLRKAVNPQT